MNHDLVKDIFEQAIDVSADNREAFIHKASAGNAEVILEVKSLLSCTSDEDDNEVTFDPIIGVLAGPWRIEKRIGGGGMGRVYAATDHFTNKPAAVKILRRVLVDRSASKRFEQEIRVLGRIEHDGVARIKGAGTVELEGDRVPWIAMELIEDAIPITAYAKTKKQVVKLKLLRDVCLAVGEAHKHGVIHRDLKPSNILIDKFGDPKIIDFGIAKVIDNTLRPTGLLTETGGMLGTLQYMPPESYMHGSEPQTTGDVYSIGVIMYEMLAGHRPYELEGASLPALVQVMATTDLTPIDVEFPIYKGAIAAVVHKALSREPQKRYSSANEFAEDLQHLIEGTPVSARIEPYFVRLIRQHRVAATILAVTIPILAIATAVSTYFAVVAQYQLARNEKLLLFATDAMQIQTEILHQNPKYWAMHVGVTKQIADDLTKEDLMLRVEMYDLLGKQGMASDVTPSLYREAALIAASSVGVNAPETLLIEAKAITTSSNLGRSSAVEKLRSILQRWEGGTAKQQSELLALVASGELKSPDIAVRANGHAHAIESERIARRKLVGDIQAIIVPIRSRVWSLLFVDDDTDSFTKAIDLLLQSVLPILEEAYHPNDSRTLQYKTLLAIAYSKRSQKVEFERRLADIDEALRLNEFVVSEIVKQSGDSHNSSWRWMNNLAYSLVTKSEWLEENMHREFPIDVGLSDHETLETIPALRQRAASIWQRILQQTHFKKGDGYSPGKWYLKSFQDSLPDFAPSDNEYDEWVKMIDQMPTKSDDHQ